MEIMQYAKSKGMVLLSYNFYYEWCDKNVIGSPLEFATYVKYADYVITSTFHGSIFSILLNKQFISTNKENMKIKCLLDQFQLSSRHTDRVEVLDKEIDYRDVNIEIIHSRKSAEDYLKQIL
jgi:exopolysaccharide biosynthesis predicted pyruvyltransferase EpsI